ncbi:unnamed protein product [Durusdinium trenchii]|uniref:Uncharacterized protein n=2 Tax=Durusdinium trenchii TaxID=1381693 RepID=A0ABP0T0K7_9DINO
MLVALQEEARAAAKARAAAFERGELPEPETKAEAPKTEPKAVPAKEEPQEVPQAQDEPEDWEAEAEKDEPKIEEKPKEKEQVKEKEAPKETEEPLPTVKKQERQPEVAPPPEEAVEEEEDEVKLESGKDSEKKIPDPRPHLNVVFIGHVDAGKSTTCGNILFLCGMVDDRTIEKYKQEAAGKAGESWFLAFIMDTSEEEKVKGKTVEDEQVIFLPMSGLMGDNIKEKKGTPSWYEGPTLLDALDGITVLRKAEGPVRIPMMEGYKDMGAVTAIGKVEQGTIKPGMKCIVMPTYNKCTVTSVFINDVDMQYATCGENVTLKMSGISDEELKKGYVLCADKTPIPVVSKFKATIHVIELGPDRPVMTSGYVAVMHAHTASEECEILKLYETMVIQTKKKEKNPQFARPDSVVVCSIKLARPTAVDTFQSSQQLGRFTLRVDGRTIAIGKITELPKTATENA